MHLLLTDRLTCPRCGPEFGLILLAHQVRDRRILEGELGCANCRERYPVVDGFGDLRPPPRRPLPGDEGMGETGPAPGPEASGEEALRLAALMGVAAGPGTILIKGPAALHARAVVALVEGIEVVGMDPVLLGGPEEVGVSRMVAGPGFPFMSSCARSVVLSGDIQERDVLESLRVLIPHARVVALGAHEEMRAWLEAGGGRVILEEDGVLVVEREGRGPERLVSLRAP